MRCEWCGEETSDDSAFCARCGHRLQEGAAAEGAFGGEGHADEQFVSSGALAGSSVHGAIVGNSSSDSGVQRQELPAPNPEKDELVDAPSAVGDAFGFELAFDDDGPVEFVQDDFFSHDAVIPPVQPPDDGGSLVDAPSAPDELVLGRSYVAIIAVMATLFAAAVILLTCVVLMRVLGL